MEQYKEDIRNTRLGCLGSSDAKMLRQVAAFGNVPKSALKRLAVCKGLTEQKEIPRTDAIRYGDEIELMIFEHLKSQDERYESNPCWVSEKYSRYNCKCIDHPDIVLEDKENKVLRIYEVKTSKHDTMQLRQEYKEQLFHHTMMGRERATRFGKGWKVKVYLVHYNTEGLDLSQDCEFDTCRLCIKEVRMGMLFDLGYAMEIVSKFLEDFNEYYEGDVIDAEYLPEKVREEFDNVTMFLKEIKEREEKVAEFKARLFEFMKEKDIKNISCSAFSITRVDETTSKSFDHKRYLEDFKQEHPRKAEKVIRKYTKETKKSGYCTIKINKDKSIEDIFK